MSKIKLPIKTSIPDSYMWTPMGVLLAHEETLDWYYENFIGVCCDNSMNARLLDVSNGFLGFYCNVFSYSVSKYEDISVAQIVARLQDELVNHGNYAYIYLDEYYLSVKDYYHEKHCRHQSLIYGFDDDRSVFNAFAFDKNGHLAELEYPYAEIDEAYEGGIRYPDQIIEPYAAAFFKIVPQFEHKINFANVIHALEDYINGARPQNLRFVQTNIIKGDVEIPQRQTITGPFGVNVARYMAERLVSIKKTSFDFNDFRRIHFLYDHSKMLTERLEYYKRYISEEYYQEYCGRVEAYHQIEGRYQRARLLYMKMSQLVSQADNGQEIQAGYLRRVADILRETVASEKEVLASVLESLKKWWKAEQSQCPDFIGLTAQDAYTLQLDRTDDETTTAEIRFHDSTFVKLIRVANTADVTMWVDDEWRERLYYGDRISPNDYTDILIEKNISGIKIAFRSKYHVTFEDLDVRIFGGNIFYGKKAVSSSVWDQENEDKGNHMPELALTEFSGQYWRAAAQMDVYDGKDWIEVDLEKPRFINRITIEENEGYPRIVRYRILSYDQRGNEMCVGTYTFDTGKKNLIDFKTVQASKIRIEFLECMPDRYGYAEPIVKHLRGFYVR